MRSTAFIVLIISSLVIPWWLFLFVAVLYAFRYTAYELLMIGVFLDGYLGAPLPWLPIPVFYTGALFLIIFIAEILKPMLSFYEQT